MEKSESVNKRKNNFQNWVKIMEIEKKKEVKILVIDDVEVKKIILDILKNEKFTEFLKQKKEIITLTRN